MATFADLKGIIQAQDEGARLEMRLEMRRFGEEAQNYFEDVVARWNHKPKMSSTYLFNPTYYSVQVIPTGQYALIFTYVDLGTKPHVIRPKKKGGLLKFKTGYQARTAAVARYNVGSGQALGGWRSKKIVNHPGTAARKFSLSYSQRLNPPFYIRIQDAITRGIRAGGS